MSESVFRMQLPATSANLGSGFDTAAVALSFSLEIEAAPSDEFSIDATGSDAQMCAQLENNLILKTYCDVLSKHGAPIRPLAIRMHNGIPLGMGCGSSAAGRLASIAMAVHFGNLKWSNDQILEEACAQEGHPDNAAACWLGGFVAAAQDGRSIQVARVAPPAEWRVIIVHPAEALPTSTARAVLPTSYSSAEVVTNLQSVSMLGLAFAQKRGDLLRTAMRDRIHQPYRSEICPLLPRLLPLAGREGILGVALSGAGPAVLVIVRSEDEVGSAGQLIKSAVSGICTPRLLECRFEERGAMDFLMASQLSEA